MTVTILAALLLMLTVFSRGDLFDSLGGLDIDEQLSRLDDMINSIDLGDDDDTDDLTDDDGCSYTCKNGGTPVPRKTHTPSFNGCGAFGFEISTDKFPEMTTCCNHHDLCYDTCNKDRDRCDDDFKKCLDKICYKKRAGLTQKEHTACENGAMLMYQGTTALGCYPYLTSQENACVCVDNTKPKRGHENSSKSKKDTPRPNAREKDTTRPKTSKEDL